MSKVNLRTLTTLPDVIYRSIIVSYLTHLGNPNTYNLTSDEVKIRADALKKALKQQHHDDTLVFLTLDNYVTDQDPTWFVSFMVGDRVSEVEFINHMFIRQSNFDTRREWLISQFIGAAGILMILKATQQNDTINEWKQRYPILSIITETAARDQSTFLSWMNDLHVDYDWSNLRPAIEMQGDAYRLDK